MKKNIKAFIKEIVPVVVGILIALYINNWNENRKEAKYIDKIFIAINKELSETNDDITEKLAIQEAFIDTLDVYIENDTISILDVMMKTNGVSGPTVRMNAWKSISNSKIELIAYDKLSALADIEEAKENLKMREEKLTDFIYTNTNETERDKKELLKFLKLDVMSAEIYLQKDIEKIISK